MTFLQTIWNWNKARKDLAKLQHKIAEAYRAGKMEEVARLQRILVKSAGAIALAIRAVLTNSGGRTPGVDNWVAKGSDDFWYLLTTVSSYVSNISIYTPKPAKRVWIPKGGLGSTALRPLGIPTILDRVMHMLYSYALQPIAGIKADDHSFGFRSGRGTHDAVFTAAMALTTGSSWPQMIYDADIQQFFPTISHDWLLNNVPMDPRVLLKFLKSGALDKGSFEPSNEGVPQGSPISPVISNLALDGLQAVIAQAAGKIQAPALRAGVVLVRYADDFIVIGLNEKMKWFFGKSIIPLIKAFLAERGLKLHPTKTKLLSRTDGFTFLGFTIKWVKNRFNPSKNMLLIQPSEANVDKFAAKVAETIDSLGLGLSIKDLIIHLNMMIGGWGNNFQYGHNSDIFGKLDRIIWKLVFRWIIKKLPRSNMSSRMTMFKHDGMGLQPFYVNKAGDTKFLKRLSAVRTNTYGPIRGGKFKGRKYTFARKTK